MLKRMMVRRVMLKMHVVEEGHVEAYVDDLDVECDGGLKEGKSKHVEGGDDVHMGQEGQGNESESDKDLFHDCHNEFLEGIYFTNKEAFKDAIRIYVVYSKISLKIINNDNKRVKVKCIGAQAKCDGLHIVVTYHQPILGN
ncbi:hypothetical protein VNO80_09960 [Phaseolus coccineus]|uniref:Transposase MuDR plant domain-containing protein n=1 Tax=Phaseolus coccineus TaxID=3886 RepID=A0AAN9RA27_PHACN